MENDTQVCDLSWNATPELEETKEDDKAKNPVAVFTINKQKLLIYTGITYTIGRGANASLVVPVKSLSKNHVEIQHIGGAHLIKDLGSKNKTKRGQLVLIPEVMYELPDMSISPYTLLLADTPAHYHYISDDVPKERDWLQDTVHLTAPPTCSSTPSKTVRIKEDAVKLDITNRTEDGASSDVEFMPASQFVPNIDESADLLYVEDSPQNSPLKLSPVKDNKQHVPETPAPSKAIKRGLEESVDASDDTSMMNREKELKTLNLMLQSNTSVTGVSTVPESQAVNILNLGDSGSECGSAIVDLNDNEDDSAFVITETQHPAKATAEEEETNQDDMNTQCWDMELTDCVSEDEDSTNNIANHTTGNNDADDSTNPEDGTKSANVDNSANVSKDGNLSNTSINSTDKSESAVHDKTELSMLSVTIGSNASFSPQTQRHSDSTSEVKKTTEPVCDTLPAQDRTKENDSSYNRQANEHTDEQTTDTDEPEDSVIEAPAFSVSDLQNSVDKRDEKRRSSRNLENEDDLSKEEQDNTQMWQTILEQSISDVDSQSIAKTPPMSPDKVNTSHISDCKTKYADPLDENTQGIEMTPPPLPAPKIDRDIEKTPPLLITHKPEEDDDIERTPPPAKTSNRSRNLHFDSSTEDEVEENRNGEDDEQLSDVDNEATDPPESLDEIDHDDKPGDMEGIPKEHVRSTENEVVPSTDIEGPRCDKLTSAERPVDEDIVITHVQGGCSLEITGVKDEDSVNFIDENPCTLELDVQYCGGFGDFAAKEIVKDEPSSQGGETQKAFYSMFEPTEGDQEEPESQLPDLEELVTGEKSPEVVKKEATPIKRGRRGKAPAKTVKHEEKPKGRGGRRKKLPENKEEASPEPVKSPVKRRVVGRSRKKKNEEFQQEKEPSPEPEKPKTPEKTTILKLEGVEDLLRKRRELKEKMETKAIKMKGKGKQKKKAAVPGDDDDDELPDFGGFMDDPNDESDSDEIVEIDLLTSNIGKTVKSPVKKENSPVKEIRKTSEIRTNDVKKAKELPKRGTYRRKRILSSESEASELPVSSTIDESDTDNTEPDKESVVDSQEVYKPPIELPTRKSRRRTDSASTQDSISSKPAATRPRRKITAPKTVPEKEVPEANITSRRGRVLKIKPEVQVILSESRPKRSKQIKFEDIPEEDIKPIVRKRKIISEAEAEQENIKPNVGGKQSVKQEVVGPDQEGSLVLVTGNRKRKKITSPVDTEQVTGPKPLKITNYLEVTAKMEVPASPRRSTVVKQEVHIVYTGIEAKGPEKRIISGLGGLLSDNINKCSHLVTDKIKRTLKFLCAIGRGIPIVTEDWIIQSKGCKAFVDATDFMVKDKATEKLYKFVLTKSLTKARQGPFLSGWSVYVTKTCVPNPQQITPILACNGATLLKKPPSANEKDTLILATEKDNLISLRKTGVPVCSTEVILTGALRQELCVEEFRL